MLIYHFKIQYFLIKIVLLQKQNFKLTFLLKYKFNFEIYWYFV